MTVGNRVRSVLVGVVAAATAVAVPATTANAAHGHGWELVSAGELGETTHLSAVSAAGPHAAWAAGYQVVGFQSRGLLLRWDGREWAPDDAPGLPEAGRWLSVSATSARDVWAHGQSPGGEDLVAHFDGHRWRTVETPEQPDQGGDVADLEAVSGRAWLAYHGAISAYVHGAWQTLELDPGTNIRDLDAPSAHDAWAVGEHGSTNPDERRPVVLHWDDGRWTEVPLDRPELYVTNVHAESDDSVYVVAGEVLDDETHTQRVLHWDGEEWEELSGPTTNLFVDTVTGDGDGTVWFSGVPDDYLGPPEFWRYDARRDTWTLEEGATVDGDTHAHRISDLAPVGRDGGYWAVGTYNEVVGESRSDTFELVYRRWH